MRNAKRVPDISDRQEAHIQAGIAADPENAEITKVEFSQMRPAAEMLPVALYAALTRPRGRPKADTTKVPLKLRLDRKTVEVFRASGDGWQTRMNDVLMVEAKRMTMNQTHVIRAKKGVAPVAITTKKVAAKALTTETTVIRPGASKPRSPSKPRAAG